MNVRLSLDGLRDLVIRALVASQTSPSNARLVGDALVAAEADGIRSHGASRTPFYADQALSGKVDGFATPQLERRAPAAVYVDARDGFAYPAIDVGLRCGAEIAAETGVVAVAIGRSHHFGAAGYHVETLANRGLIGLAFGNTPAAMAPWGATRAIFGTNPVALACPRERSTPLVIDLSLSQAARGRVLLAERAGEPIPEGWALDAEGRPTTNAKAALSGTMRPVGDAKGSALALMVEILAAALTGSNYAYEASSFFEATGPPPRVGQLFILVNPDVFAGVGFSRRVDALLRVVQAESGARLPGARRLAHRAKARVEGVAIDAALYQDLMSRTQSPSR